MSRNELYRRLIDRFIEDETSRTNGPRAAEVYVQLHTARFGKMLAICSEYVPGRKSRVLDVGRSGLTALLASYYENVTSIGYDLSADEGGHREQSPLPGVPHIVFDLNESVNCESWPEYSNEFDLIAVCETVEHLPTAPEFTLLMLSSFLRPGGTMLVTVPNAVALSKRIKILLGRNPFERIRFFLQNPGHFREYTRRELVEIGQSVGLETAKSYTTSLSPPGKRIIRNLIPSMREGVVVIFRKPGA